MPKFGTIAHQYLVSKTTLGILKFGLISIFTAWFQKQMKTLSFAKMKCLEQ